MSGTDRVVWGQHVSIFQWRRPAFWVFAALLAFSGFVAAAEQSLYFGVAPVGVVLSWVLLVFYLVPMALIVYKLDLYEREPITLSIGAFLWGAVVATTAAGIANGGWGVVVLVAGGPEFAAAWSAALTAPFTEEILKGAGIVLLYQIAPREFDDVIDGFVYGGLCGLGFAVVEDVYYFVAVFGGDVPSVLAGFFLRVIASGLYGHVLYTGLVGMGIAWFVTRRGPRRVPAAVALVAAGIGMHFLWNSPLLDYLPSGDWSAFDVFVLVPLALAVKGVPFLVFVGLVVRLGLQRERRWLREVAERELGHGLTDDDLTVLESPLRRRAAVRATRRRAGRRAGSALERLHTEQLNLLMLRARRPGPSDEAIARQRRRCSELRESLDGYEEASRR